MAKSESEENVFLVTPSSIISSFPVEMDSTLERLLPGKKVIFVFI